MGTAILSLLCDGQRSPDQALSASVRRPSANDRHRFILGGIWLYNLLLPDHRLRRALGVRPSAELGRSPRSNAQSSRPAVSKTFRSAGLLSSASESGHHFILGETWLYNLLPLDHSPAAFRRFRSAGLSSSASKSVKRSLYMLKRCLLSFFSAVLSDW